MCTGDAKIKNVSTAAVLLHCHSTVLDLSERYRLHLILFSCHWEFGVLLPWWRVKMPLKSQGKHAPNFWGWQLNRMTCKRYLPDSSSTVAGISRIAQAIGANKGKLDAWSFHHFRISMLFPFTGNTWKSLFPGCFLSCLSSLLFAIACQFFSRASMLMTANFLNTSFRCSWLPHSCPS